MDREYKPIISQNSTGSSVTSGRITAFIDSINSHVSSVRKEHGRVECDKHGMMAVYIACLLADPFRSLLSTAVGFPHSCNQAVRKVAVWASPQVGVEL